jgi:hypothetical protein
LLDAWLHFIGQVKSGYTMCISEYDNDLSVRDAIDAVIRDEGLRHFDDYAAFANRVAELDIHFKSLLSTHAVRPGDTWWRRGVPTHGGEELATDFRILYDAQVEINQEL